MCANPDLARMSLIMTYFFFATQSFSRACRLPQGFLASISSTSPEARKFQKQPHHDPYLDILRSILLKVLPLIFFHQNEACCPVLLLWCGDSQRYKDLLTTVSTPSYRPLTDSYFFFSFLKCSTLPLPTRIQSLWLCPIRSVLPIALEPIRVALRLMRSVIFSTSFDEPRLIIFPQPRDDGRGEFGEEIGGDTEVLAFFPL